MRAPGEDLDHRAVVGGDDDVVATFGKERELIVQGDEEIIVTGERRTELEMVRAGRAARSDQVIGNRQATLVRRPQLAQISPFWVAGGDPKKDTRALGR